MAFEEYHDLLRDAVNDKGHIRSNKSDVIDYYRAEYGKGGTRKAAEALHALGIVKNRQGEPVQVKSLMRRFQQRGGKSQAEASGTYAAMGKDIPLKFPDAYTIQVKGKQGERTRGFTARFTGKAAQDFAKHPTYSGFFKHLGYPKGVIDRFNTGAEGESDPELEVTGVT